ncbi:MAG: class I adenylate-forming enzyme family protein [Acidobacteriota bacterium]
MSQSESYWLDKTLPQLLRENVQRDPDGPSLIWDGGRLSWTELDHRSSCVASGLSEIGVKTGDVVSCQLANRPEFIVLHHALAKCGAVFNPIHLAYRGAETQHIVDFSESSWLVVGPSVKGFSYLDMALEIKSRLSGLKQIVAVGEPDREEGIPFERLEQTPARSLSVEPRPDDPFMMFFTSGTTASPKATIHTYNMRLTNSWFCARDMGIRKDDGMLCPSPLSHLWALLNYWSSVIQGCPQILLERYRPEDFRRTVSRGETTVIMGAPAHAMDLLAPPLLDAEILSRIRRFALSGTTCPPVLVSRMREVLPNCKPIVFWGMTEMGGAFYTRPEDPPEIIENTVGRASGPCVVAVVDEEGQRLPPGREGELSIKSPFAIEAYFKNPEATQGSVRAGGWFRTGDLGKMDPNGNIQILGRQKELINRGGVKFLPQNVEEVLLRHLAVHMVAIVGMPDERLGERNACFVVPTAGEAPPSLEDLCQLLEKEGTSKFMWPERLELVESLPLTPTGKIQRAVLRERL